MKVIIVRLIDFTFLLLTMMSLDAAQFNDMLLFTCLSILSC